MADINPVSGEITSQGINDNLSALDSQKVEKSGDRMTGNLEFRGLRGLLWSDGDVGTTGELANFPDTTSDTVTVRFFRNTNTSGEKRIQILKGDGTTGVDFALINGAIVTINGQLVSITAGSSPEGSVTANVGSIHLRTTGGAGTTLYVKESGSGNTGWVAK